MAMPPACSPAAPPTPPVSAVAEGRGAWARGRGCMAARARGCCARPNVTVCRRACPAGFIPYQGQGFALLIPSKWNPSKERDYPNVVFRCAGARRMRSGGAGCVGLQNGAAKGVQPAEGGGLPRQRRRRQCAPRRGRAALTWCATPRRPALQVGRQR